MGKIAGFTTRYAYALFSCLYVFSIGFLKSRNRFLIDTICTHFGYTQDPARGIARLPTIPLSAVIREDTAFTVRDPVAVEGNPSLLELVVINKLIRAREPRAIFEIGTFNGRTTLNMAANCPKEGRIFTLDLPPEKPETALEMDVRGASIMGREVIGSKYRGTECETRITQLFGDSARFDFSPFRDSIDFVFIDAAHSYEYALSDSKKAIELLRGGRGVILWHNYGPLWAGVMKALAELHGKDARFKVCAI